MNKNNFQNSILSVKGLCKSFKNGDSVLEVLQGVDLEIKKGELTSLVGESGCGKSTLLHIIGMLDKADSGIILYNGEDCSLLSEDKKTQLRLKKIGFVYQTPNLFKDFTALENVMMPLLIAGCSMEEARREAMILLDEMELIDRVNHRPFELSGGQCQRVAIARALANNPEILFADEPTGNLDPKTSKHVFDILVKTVKKKNLSCFLVTHNNMLASRADTKYTIVNKKLKKI